jgi:hypothetical protein
LLNKTPDPNYIPPIPDQFIAVMIDMQGTDDLIIGSGSDNNGGDFKEEYDPRYFSLIWEFFSDSTTLINLGSAKKADGTIYGLKCKYS